MSWATPAADDNPFAVSTSFGNDFHCWSCIYRHGTELFFVSLSHLNPADLTGSPKTGCLPRVLRV